MRPCTPQPWAKPPLSKTPSNQPSPCETCRGPGEAAWAAGTTEQALGTGKYWGVIVDSVRSDNSVGLGLKTPLYVRVMCKGWNDMPSGMYFKTVHEKKEKRWGRIDSTRLAKYLINAELGWWAYYTILFFHKYLKFSIIKSWKWKYIWFNNNSWGLQYLPFSNGGNEQAGQQGNRRLEQHHKPDLTDFLKTLHPTTTEHTFFWSARGIFFRRDHMLGHKKKRNKI